MKHRRASLTTRDSWFFRRPFITSGGISTATSEDVKTFKTYNNKFIQGCKYRRKINVV